MMLMLMAALLALSVSFLIFVVYRRSGELPDTLLSNCMQAVTESLNRLILSVVFAAIMLIQMSIASRVYTDAEAENLQSLFSLGPVSLDPWNMILIFLTLWMAAPMVVQILTLLYCRRKYGEEILEEEFWSDQA